MSLVHPRVKQRLKMISAAFIVMAMAVSIGLYALQNSVTYFFTPSDIEANPTILSIAPDRLVRLGGMVEEGSFESLSDGDTQYYSFDITDFSASITVHYSGALPSLFREGQGVVAEGTFNKDENVFIAERILAKHDENYMPPEIYESMKENGYE